MLRNTSITTRLTAMNLLVALSALVLAFSGFFTYDVLSIRTALVRGVTAQAQIVAEASASAVVFNDPDVARRSLVPLRATPNVTGAVIYTSDGQEFARYGTDFTVPPAVFREPTTGVRSEFTNDALIVAAPVMAGDKLVGELYLSTSLHELNGRLARYLLIATGVLVLSVLGGLLISTKIRKSVSEPIIGLAETADRVTREKNFSLRARPIPGAGELTLLVSSFNEMLSEIERRDQAVRDLARESLATIESIPQLVFTTDSQGDVLVLNDRWYAYTGMARDEDPDRWPEYIHEEDRPRAAEAWRLSVETGEPYRVEYRLYRYDGEYRWHLAQALPIRNEQGEIEKWFGTCTDVHERRMAEVALVRSEKLAATGRMAASIAHEINNPLAAITNAIHLLKHFSQGRAQETELVTILDEEAKRVSHIVKSTLGLARQTSSPSKVRLDQLVDDVLVLFERRLASRAIRVERRYWPGIPEIEVFSTEIRQTISNLIANAMDVSNSGDNIIVSVRPAKWNGEAGVRLAVCDQGPGIPQALRERIFEPFFSTKLDLGTGLGLWISKGIVEKHGGRLRFRSRSGITHGTIFTIFLPQASKIVLAPEKARPNQSVA